MNVSGSSARGFSERSCGVPGKNHYLTHQGLSLIKGRYLAGGGRS